MEISNRLLKMAELISPCNTLADIGTDHGYLPMELVRKGKIQYGIACDLKNGPLLRAQKHIKSYGLSDKICTRLGNGFAPIAPGEADAASIAGMGGMLMIKIMQEGQDVIKEMKQLVLQPQLDIPAVRRYVHKIGFRIEREEMLLEDGKFYTILCAEPGAEHYEREEEYWFGKCLLERRDPVLQEAIKQEFEKQQEVINRLLEAETQTAKRKRLEIQEKHRKYEEVLKWLSTAKRL